jgi:acyl dehydratase
MAIDTQALGRTFEPHAYAVSREGIRAYARAVGETNELHFDLDAARGAGHPDLVAPPMFAVVYCSAAIEQALFDPAVGIDFAMLVHGGQEFEWGPLVFAGDEITTQIAVAEIYERIGMAFYVFESHSTSQHGTEVSRGTWTQIVRPRP